MIFLVMVLILLSNYIVVANIAESIKITYFTVVIIALILYVVMTIL